MSTPIPAKIPRWADNGGDIVEPQEAKKDIGWLGEEEPPAQYLNWWMNLAEQWFAVASAQVGSIKKHTLVFIPTQNGTLQWNTGTGKLTVVTLTGGIAEAAFPLKMDEGEKLTAVTVRANKGDTSQMTVAVSLISSGTVSSLGSANSSASGAVAITPSVTAHTLASNEMITVDVLSHFVGDVIFVVEYTTDRSGGY